ncbi:MAG: AAA family ATPase [Candidatus Anstonellales archaeon]
MENERIFEKLSLVFTTNLRMAESLEYKRFLYPVLKSKIVKNKLILLYGVRGTGKTTLMLQVASELMKEGKRVFYFPLDHWVFSLSTFYDFVEFLYKKGIEYIFVDEVHKYPNWVQEIKNIYDGLDVKILASGSNPSLIIKGKYDLSRRVIDLQLPPLSYREYIEMKTGKKYIPLTLEKIVNEWDSVQRTYPYVDISEYMQYSMPFFLSTEREEYEKSVMNIVEKVVYEDLLSYNFNTTTILHAKSILGYIASNPAGEVSISSISGRIDGMSKGSVGEVLKAFESIGLIHSVPSLVHGKGLLRPNKKYYLSPPFRWFICKMSGRDSDIGSLREDFFVSHLFNRKVEYPSEKGEPDFIVDRKYVFEIGGKTKTKKQIIGKKNAFLVKDVMFSYDSIPLFLFGYLY